MAKPGSRAEKVLRLLRRSGDFVSSHDICSELGISRAAVWKQIEGLRSDGYDIEGVSSMGYRLLRVPDALRVLEADRGFDPLRIGRRIVALDETGSTNEDAWQLGLEGAEEGTVVLAEMQRAGRGRRGRRWVSPAGTNLYASVLLRPAVLPAEAALLTLLAAVELCETLRETLPVAPGIKWPNDVLLEGAKVAGILAEMHAEQETIHFLVLGIGVNLNMTREMFPGELTYPATSVRCVLGRPVERVPFTRRLLENLDRGYERFLREGARPLRKRWLSFCVHLGGSLEVDTPKGILRGRFEDIDDEGALVLEVAPGATERIRAGDVIRVSPPVPSAWPSPGGEKE
ncbi:MAG: biotin--[acetyl-CoA-carboxylase] ligase [bacterium]